MSDSTDDTPVFNFVASIQGREFIVTILQNRMSQWDDLRACGLTDRLQEEASAGDVISVRISDEIFLKAAAMAQKEKAEEAMGGQFQVATAKDIVEIDRLFEDFFWLKVNPQLNLPLKLDCHKT